MVSNPLARTVGNALQAIGGDAILTSATGGFTPIMAARGMARKTGEALARGRQGKIDDVTALLLRDVGGSPRPGMPGDAMPPLTSRGGPTGGSAPQVENAFAQTMSNQQTVPSQNAFTRSLGLPQLQLRTDSMNALAFGTVGGLAPADSTEDRLRNAAIGAAFGVGGGRAQRAWAAKQPLVLGPKDEVLTLTNELPASDLLKAQRPAGADNLKRLGEIQTLLDTRRKALAQQPVERGATDDEWTEAIGEAKRRINDVYRGRGLADEISLSARGDDAIRVTVAEDLADVILREKGLDPGGAKSRWIASRGTNKKAAETRARRAAEDAQRQAERDAMDEIDIAVMEFEDANPNFSLGNFAEIAARESGSNMPASEMTARDIFELAQRLARQFDEKGGQGATKAETAAKQFVTWVDENVVGGLSGNRGNPTRASGLGAAPRTDLGNAFAQSVLGGAGGSAYGSQNDINGDGVIDEQDVFLGSAAGTVGTPLAARMMRGGGENAFSMGAGGRKPPPDSPEAITEAVRGISRSVPSTPPGGPVIPPRGNMRGVLQAPERVPPASPMADQVPPPLPPRPVSNRVPTSNMPNATEIGLMAGTGAAIGGAFLMEKANDPATFGLASFDQLPPEHPLRDPQFRQMALMAQMKQAPKAPPPVVPQGVPPTPPQPLEMR